MNISDAKHVVCCLLECNTTHFEHILYDERKDGYYFMSKIKYNYYQYNVIILSILFIFGSNKWNIKFIGGPNHMKRG